MELDAVVGEARSMIGADRVFGEPYQQNGITVIPAAKIAGGGGAGEDESEDGGGGGGFGVRARPAGALVIREDGTVKWKVPFDLTRIVLAGQLVGVAYFFFAWLTERSKARAAAKAAVVTSMINRRTS